MKALTIRQPWAWAIIHAGKDIENRSWRTRFRGELAVHAAGRISSEAQLPRGSKKPREKDLVCSAIIGVVEIIDLVERSRSKWFMGEYGFVLANPRRLLKPIPCKGRLGLWNLPPHILRKVNQQLRRKSAER